MPSPDVQSIADQLWNAYHNHELIDPIRFIIDTNDIQSAYAIQNLNIQRRINNGAIIKGKKIGITSLAVQKQLGVDQPDFGILLDDMEVVNGGVIESRILHQPKVEGEIAFVICSDILEPITDMQQMIDVVDYVSPAIEIVGSRIKNWDIKFVDTIADNASASHYVLGKNKVYIGDFDINDCAMSLFINDIEVSKGHSSACMDNPLNACIWLANKMIELDQPLKAGEVILSGALGPFVGIVSGDQVVCKIEGLGDVEVAFS